MQQLKELESKVLAIVAKNKELQSQVTQAHKENEELKAKLADLESSLTQETSAHTELSDERQSICSSIDQLLINIDTLEETPGV